MTPGRSVLERNRDAWLAIRGLSPITSGLFLAAALVVGSFLAASARDGTFAIDLRHAFLPAAERVLHGHDLYPGADQLSATDRTAYVYPPLAAVLLAPVAWLPSLAVGIVGVVLLAATLAATLRLLGVDDPRCYAIAFLWGPVLAALQTANLTPLLGLAAAAAWRFRGSGRGLAALTAALVPKLFLWPLSVWALAARHARTAVLAVAVAVAVTFAAWGVVGFAGLGAYPHLLRRLQRLEERDSYSLFALARALGAGDGLSRAIWLAVGLAALASCVVLARRGDDRRAFTLAIAASLLLTPVVWLHYFALLLVPLAIARPRLDWAWLLPVVLIGGSGTGNGGVARTILVLGVAGAVTAASLAPAWPRGTLPQLFGRRSTTTDELL